MDVLLENEQCECQSFLCFLAKDTEAFVTSCLSFWPVKYRVLQAFHIQGFSSKCHISSGIEGHSLCSRHLILGFDRYWQLWKHWLWGSVGQGSSAQPVLFTLLEGPPCLALSQPSFGDCIRSPPFVKGDKGAGGTWSLVSLSVVGPQALICWLFCLDGAVKLKIHLNRS